MCSTSSTKRGPATFPLYTHALATGIVIDATHCRATLRALRDLAPVRRVGAGPLRVNVAFGRIGTGERTLSSFDGRLCGSGNYPGDFVGVDLELLSLVGPILSVGTTAMEAGAGGPPYSDAHWETLDVRTGAVVDITEWIDAASLLDALAADPYLAEHHAEAAAAVGAADSYADAVEVLIPALGGALGAFAILDWSERDGTVGIRLALPVNNCGMCPAVLESLSLRVQPRPELLRHLRSAARGDGHFLSAGPISAL